jgi:uncharacterized protein with PQ loop repeat
MGEIVGWLALGVGICVPLPQIAKLLRGEGSGVSIGTYALLCVAMAGYLVHAISISSEVFIAAQSVNLATNSIVLVILLRRKYGRS